MNVISRTLLHLELLINDKKKLCVLNTSQSCSPVVKGSDKTDEIKTMQFRSDC